MNLGKIAGDQPLRNRREVINNKDQRFQEQNDRCLSESQNLRRKYFIDSSALSTDKRAHKALPPTL